MKKQIPSISVLLQTCACCLCLRHLPVLRLLRADAVDEAIKNALCHIIRNADVLVFALQRGLHGVGIPTAIFVGEDCIEYLENNLQEKWNELFFDYEVL
jgi:hypothetical protein